MLKIANMFVGHRLFMLKKSLLSKFTNKQHPAKLRKHNKAIKTKQDMGDVVHINAKKAVKRL